MHHVIKNQKLSDYFQSVKLFKETFNRLDENNTPTIQAYIAGSIRYLEQLT